MIALPAAGPEGAAFEAYREQLKDIVTNLFEPDTGRAPEPR